MQDDHTEHAGSHQHHDHGGHRPETESHSGHTMATHAPATWKMAASATLHCLTGCAIGEILGLVIGTALGWHNAPTMVLAIVLAFVFGYGLTMRGALAAGLGLGAAVSLALAADTVSIIVMEIVDNAVVLAVPGAMDAGLADGLFWGSLIFALAVAFVITTPVNKWMIGRGKGHAVVHSLHGH
ncbi:hypothetical protein BJY24_003648 [Nocardia transvalensis]|uniref:DUF4396 domain-containing protein n=1 Tax=Nocardia transvalensis TaxID=37333 RepID=A0A7W9PEZ9_9NOCA|nr:DUF4396 domain-containing protein [Nocardia transvalensis]MBB5914781.1 hypothetical protein [Nocardia transvalensis]